LRPFGHNDDDDNRTLTTYPNGVTEAAAYDDSSRLTTIEGKRGLVALTRFVYTYSMPGTVADKGSTGITTYDHDALDRLKTAVTKDLLGLTTADYAYGYDAAGNRTSETLNGVAKETKVPASSCGRALGTSILRLTMTPMAQRLLAPTLVFHLRSVDEL
jgi:YD repeat-containing protein